MSEPHRLAVRIYYEDTDFSGVVYHASYLRFLERGRTEFLRDLGVTQGDLRDSSGAPIGFAVRRMEIDYLKPARMDDLLTVETTVTTVTGATLQLEQAIRRDGDVLTQANVVVVAITGGRPRRLPPDLARRIIHGQQPAAVSTGNQAEV